MGEFASVKSVKGAEVFWNAAKMVRGVNNFRL